MDFAKIWETFFGMITLKDDAYKTAAGAGMGIAFLNLLLVMVASALGGFWLTLDLLGLIMGVIVGYIMAVILYFISVGIVWVFAKIFGGSGDYTKQFTATSFIALWGVLYVIPFIGGLFALLGGLWGVVMSVWMIKNVHSISTLRSVFVVLIPYVLLFLVALFALVAFIGGLVTAGVLNPEMFMPA